MDLTTNEVLTLLTILLVLIGIVVLFNAMFIAYTVRKIVKRVDTVTTQVEEVILKPIGMADTLVVALTDFIDKQQKKTEKKSTKKKSKTIDV